MPQEESILQTIQENPDDDMPRLVYADWLEEQGDTAQSEFIRLQCELARLPEDKPGHSDYPRWKAREYALLTAYERKWAAPLRGLVNNYEFHRGFIDTVVIEAARFLEHAEAIVLAAPALCSVKLLDAGRLMDRVAASPHLARLTKLQLSANYLDSAAVRRLAASPHVRRLTTLHLGRNYIAESGAQALAESPHLENLAELILAGNFLTGRAAAFLTRPGCWPGLRLLDLSYNFISGPAPQALRNCFGDRVLTFAQYHPAQQERLVEWGHRLLQAGAWPPAEAQELFGQPGVSARLEDQ